MNISEIKKIQAKHEKALLAKPNVVSVGIGYKEVGGKITDELALIAGVSDKMPSIQVMRAKDVVPTSLDGCPVDVVKMGVISPFPKKRKPKVQAMAEFDARAKHRPAIPGTSAGHYAITSGTFSCVVQRDGQELLLSNNHVFANTGDAAIGDPIFQPGPIDGGTSADQIGTLFDFIPINMGGFGGGGGGGRPPSQCPVGRTVAAIANAVSWALRRKTRLEAVAPQAANLVDAALCLPTDTYIKEIQQIGKPVGVAEASIGLPVQKFGRTTQYTTDTVRQINVTVNINYGVGRSAQFINQIVAGAMSAGGDSVSYDTRLYYKVDGELKFGEIRELHNDFQSGSRIEVLSLFHNSDHKNAKKYPSIFGGTIKWASISDSIDHGIKETYSVTLRDGRRIKVTKDHSLFSADGYSSCLKPKTIEEADHFISVTKSIEVEHTDRDKWLLELLGLWIADGSWCKDKDRLKGICISTGGDNRLIEFLDTLGGFKHKSKGDFRKYSVSLVKQLLDSGLQADWTSHSKRVPHFIFTLGDEDVCHFLRGYFSGDGSSHLKKGKPIVSGCSVHRKLLNDIQVLLSRIGIRSNIDNGYISKVGYISQSKKYKINIEWRRSVKLFKEKVGFLNKDIPEIAIKANTQAERELSKRGVRSIKHMGYEQVFDLKVPGNESFVAEDILCHNSGSLVCTMDNQAVGLLFAGSDETTIINHISDVFSALGIELAS